MRPSRHMMFMEMARAAAKRATCYRLNVGAVLVRDRDVVAVGYNGAPSGQPHCTGNGCQYFTAQGCRVVHAERNALSRVATTIRDVVQCHMAMYVTHSPCGACADLVRGSGVVRDVYFETAYRDAAPIQSLVAGGVSVWQLMPSGLLVNQRTGELEPAE